MNPEREPVITVYTRHDCPLCDEALDMVRGLLDEYSFRLEEMNITTDLEVFQRYREIIPVVAVDGRDRLISLFDEGDMRRLLGRLGVKRQGNDQREQ